MGAQGQRATQARRDRLVGQASLEGRGRMEMRVQGGSPASRASKVTLGAEGSRDLRGQWVREASVEIEARSERGGRQVMQEKKVQPGRTARREGRASRAVRLLGRLARTALQDRKAHQETEAARECGGHRELKATLAREALQVWQESTADQGKMPSRPRRMIATA